MEWTDLLFGMMISSTTLFDSNSSSSASRSGSSSESERALSSAKDFMNHSSPFKTYCNCMGIDTSCSKIAYQIENDILNNYINKSGHVDKDTEEFYSNEIKAVMKILVYECQRNGVEPNFDIEKLPNRLRNGDTAILLWAGCFTRKVASPSMMKYLGIEPYENGHFVRNNIVKENPNNDGTRIIVLFIFASVFTWFNIRLMFIFDSLLPSLICLAIIVAIIAGAVRIYRLNPSGRYDILKQEKYQKMKKLEAEKQAEERRKVEEVQKQKEIDGENADKSPLTDEFRYAIEYEKNKDEWENDLK